MVSFNRTMKQMIEMFQRPKCLCKKWPKCFRYKKQVWSLISILNLCTISPFCSCLVSSFSQIAESEPFTHMVCYWVWWLTHTVHDVLV